MKRKHAATLFALLAAALYAVNAPLSKLLLAHIDAAGEFETTGREPVPCRVRRTG